jgi:sodium-dependent phosphate cotransporter
MGQLHGALGPDGLPSPSARAVWRLPAWVRAVLALAALYLFIASVNMMGAGLKCAAKDEAGRAFLQDRLFRQVAHPLAGVLAGLLVTSLVQSSSFTTSMVVGLVASGQLELGAAIPVVMGANIGTSVTNSLVAMGSVRRRLEFRRSFAGAVVHDFFNILSVALLLPLECAFGVVSRVTYLASDLLSRTRLFSDDPARQMGFIKPAVAVLGRLLRGLMVEVAGLSPTAAGAAIAGVALVLLFASLWLLVKLLRSLLQERFAGVFRRGLFRSAPVAFALGVALTLSVQSSSVTTSLVVPLLGAGVIRIRQAYPYTLGANIGTTCTAVLAALGTASAPALACALGHLLFNVYGTAVFWPLQFVPISLAKGLAKIAARRRVVTLVFLFGVFFILPLVGLLALRWAGP